MIIVGGSNNHPLSEVFKNFFIDKEEEPFCFYFYNQDDFPSNTQPRSEVGAEGSVAPS